MGILGGEPAGLLELDLGHQVGLRVVDAHDACVLDIYLPHDQVVDGRCDLHGIDTVSRAILLAAMIAAIEWAGGLVLREAPICHNVCLRQGCPHDETCHPGQPYMDHLWCLVHVSQRSQTFSCTLKTSPVALLATLDHEYCSVHRA